MDLIDLNDPIVVQYIEQVSDVIIKYYISNYLLPALFRLLLAGVFISIMIAIILYNRPAITSKTSPIFIYLFISKNTIDFKRNPKKIFRIIDQAETIADPFLRYSKTFLPTLGRLFLTGTFIEDGFRIWLQWFERRDIIVKHWNSQMFISATFVTINSIAQLGGSYMVLSSSHIRIACSILMVLVPIRTIDYHISWATNSFIRNLSLIGGIALLFTQTFETGNAKLVAGLPTLETHRSQVNYIKLFGRIALVFSFITTQSWELSFLNVIETILGFTLMMAVIIGWKTKLSALFLAIYLFVNLCNQALCMLEYSLHGDLYKSYYEFFQTLSIFGGIILLISLGPGRVSLDHSRKNR